MEVINGDGSIEKDKIINQVRDVIQTGKNIGTLTKEEEEWLRENKNVLYSLYMMAVQAKNKDEKAKVGGNDDYER